jgi:hypothetical protein
MSELVAEHLPSLIAGAVTTMSTAFLIGAVGMVFWLWKKRIDRNDENPVVRKEDNDGKFGEVLDGIGEISQTQKEGFERVHDRIDETHQMLFQHIQGELNGARRASYK